mmetsp:Transcript_11061/g.26845  ORF Transcript_11061/g.26845 Transcript_11061/m.26845 type:complete len:477 (-) Transcript_11061:1301-2731(-)
MEDHVAHHHLREEGRRARVGVPVEELLLEPGDAVGVLGRQRERREGVHDQVHPQHLDRVERRLGEDRGAHARQRARRDVHRQLELQELADVVIDAAPPLDSAHDGHEVVVHDDDIGRVLGHVRPLDAHREPHVRLLERRGVVGPVARDGDRLRHPRDHRRLDARDEEVLVQRRGARKNPELGPDAVDGVLLQLAVLVLHEVAEGLAVHDSPGGVVRGHDPALAGDGAGGLEVVSRDHAHHDARALAVLDRLRHLLAERVLDPDKAHEREPRLELDGREVGPVLGRDRAPREAERAEPGVGEIRDGALDSAAHRGVDRDGGPVCVDHFDAEVRHDLRGALGVDDRRAVRRRDHRRHALAIRGERDASPPRLVVRAALADRVVSVAKLVREEEQRALGVVAAVGRDPLLDLEECLEEGVDHGGLRELRLHLRHRLQHLRRGVMRLARDPDFDDCHAGRGEGAGLVRADGGGAAHRLAR